MGRFLRRGNDRLCGSPAIAGGVYDDARAAWLISKVDQDGWIGSLGELMLLVIIMETPTNLPDSLKSYPLRQIEAATETGRGPTRDDGSLDPGCITDSGVKLLRRVRFAQASDGPAIISRTKAETLFRLEDKDLGAASVAGWKTMFVQAVGNHPMAASNYQPLTRARRRAGNVYGRPQRQRRSLFPASDQDRFLGRPGRDPRARDRRRRNRLGDTGHECRWSA